MSWIDTQAFGAMRIAHPSLRGGGAAAARNNDDERSKHQNHVVRSSLFAQNAHCRACMPSGAGGCPPRFPCDAPGLVQRMTSTQVGAVSTSFGGP